MKWIKASSLFIALSAAMVLSYQNCGSKNFESMDSGITQDNHLSQEELPNDLESCEFNGLEIPPGQQVTAYQNSAVEYGQSCESEVRLCRNGRLTGSYNYGSCQEGAPKSCLFEGMSVPHGESVNAYQNSTVLAGGDCVSQSRQCQNGELSGSFNFASCKEDEFKSCLFNGRSLSHGSKVTAFVMSSVPYGETCLAQIRKCDDGNLSGVGDFSSCEVNKPAACRFNGRDIAHGESVKTYAASAVEFGKSCMSQERQCNNGTLSGSYAFASCVVDQPKSCMINGQTVAHGQSVRLFASASVAYGGTCVGQDRVCYNGVLSGTAQHNSCNVMPAANCSFNGAMVVHGAQVTAYESSSVAYGSSCQSQARTCSNGTLSGSYTKASCSVAAPKNCKLSDGTILAHNATKTFYKSCGQTQSRKCVNGTLSGTSTYQYVMCRQETETSSYHNMTRSEGGNNCSDSTSYTGTGPSGGGWCSSTSTSSSTVCKCN